MKKIFKKLGKWGRGAVGTIIVALVISVAWLYIRPLLQHPMSPNIISSTSPNPIINTDNTVNIVIKVTPGFKPPYVREFTETISNDNSYSCSMVLEFKTSDGFKFLPIENLPKNFRVDIGYEYQDTIKIYIEDIPSRFAPELKLRVYTLNPDTYGGTENVSMKVLEVHKVQ